VPFQREGDAPANLGQFAHGRGGLLDSFGALSSPLPPRPRRYRLAPRSDNSMASLRQKSLHNVRLITQGEGVVRRTDTTRPTIRFAHVLGEQGEAGIPRVFSCGVRE
jgi:hypothetical protein